VHFAAADDLHLTLADLPVAFHAAKRVR